MGACRRGQSHEACADVAELGRAPRVGGVNEETSRPVVGPRLVVSRHGTARR
jgi:hypothetical protein